MESPSKTDLPPLPPPRPDFAALVSVAAPDGVHIQLRINCDVTPLSDPRQKLLLHYVTQALTKLTEQVKVVPKLEVLRLLGNLERSGHGKENPPAANPT